MKPPCQVRNPGALALPLDLAFENLDQAAKRQYLSLNLGLIAVAGCDHVQQDAHHRLASEVRPGRTAPPAWDFGPYRIGTFGPSLAILGIICGKPERFRLDVQRPAEED